MSRDGFLLCGVGAGSAVRVVSVFCRWNLIEVLGEGPGYSCDLRAFQSPLFGLLLISSRVMGNGVMLSSDYFLLNHGIAVLWVNLIFTIRLSLGVASL